MQILCCVNKIGHSSYVDIADGTRFASKGVLVGSNFIHRLGNFGYVNGRR